MNKAIVSRKTLDALIRAKVATLDGCGVVEALPVTYNENATEGCNWIIPGWLGESETVRSCVERLQHYLDFLQAQFDIPAAGAGSR